MDDYESLSHRRERVRYTWLVYTERRSGILWASTFGREDTSYPQ